MLRTTLSISRQWKWSLEDAKKLKDDITNHHLGRAPFSGAKANGLEWWESLPVSVKDHPLKRMAIIILSIVPHSAEVERLFSLFGGTQSAKRVNLAVPTFENLGKLRSNYAHCLYLMHLEAGGPKHRKHAPDAGVTVDEDPDDLTAEELAEGFKDFEKELRDEVETGMFLTIRGM
ncbi:hypothetical protein C8J56DRAFT_1049352 [Mycena floridula]|nr:hypothetical protein C8J56DRAFT_1049352 [Mycena floridula]